MLLSSRFQVNMGGYIMTLFASWIVALAASIGSLFFSEVMDFVPCSLCWYQRILMYPLSILYLISFFREDKNIFVYTLPFCILGFCVAAYHNLLVWGIIPESASPCTQGIPCNSIYIDWLGFITIPLMSLTAFSVLIIIYLMERRNEKKNN